MKKSKNLFRNGPSSDITLSPEHGGPVLCMDVRNELVVTGSTDHGLRVYSLSTGKQIKELFSKNYGHTEWVTSCTILNDSRIISGGMDSNICIWDSKGVRCKFIREHTGSISKIISDDEIFLSSSYDSSIRIYDINSEVCLATLKGIHKGPICDFAWRNSLCVSGGRDGSVCIWDINTQKCIFSKNLHAGNVNKILLHSLENSNLIITAGVNDGLINFLDMRQPDNILSSRIHKGAINFLQSNNQNLVFSGSSDKQIKIIDISNNFKEVGSMKTTDSILCGEISDDLIFVGCQDGNLLCYDANSSECLFGYGCESQGGLKNIKVLSEKNKIVTSGDSGQSLQLLFD